MRITINAGTTFLISDKLGNVPVGTELGMYHEDTRFLSRYELLLDGQPPVPLMAQASDPYAATDFLSERVRRKAQGFHQGGEAGLSRF